MKVWVCSTCGTPIEPFFPQDYFDGHGIRCPSDNPDCSPRKDRELLHEGQVKQIEVQS